MWIASDYVSKLWLTTPQTILDNCTDIFTFSDINWVQMIVGLLEMCNVIMGLQTKKGWNNFEQAMNQTLLYKLRCILDE